LPERKATAVGLERVDTEEWKENLNECLTLGLLVVVGNLDTTGTISGQNEKLLGRDDVSLERKF